LLLDRHLLTDIEKTVAGIKRQHNILAQIGIDPEKEYGDKVLEALQTLRKGRVRKVPKILGLPAEITKRIPSPGPALATRIVGEVTEERPEIVRADEAFLGEALSDQQADHIHQGLQPLPL
jgi:GMP synthase (glutamine-hydrolysing)